MPVIEGDKGKAFVFVFVNDEPAVALPTPYLKTIQDGPSFWDNGLFTSLSVHFLYWKGCSISVEAVLKRNYTIKHLFRLMMYLKRLSYRYTFRHGIANSVLLYKIVWACCGEGNSADIT